MAIDRIGYSQLTGRGFARPNEDATGTPAPLTGDRPSAQTGQYASETVFSPAVELALRYNVRSVTASDAVALADAMLKAGLINYPQHQAITARHRDEANPPGSQAQTGLDTPGSVSLETVKPDEAVESAPRVDLIAELEDVLATQRSQHASQAALDRTEDALELLRKIESIHALAG